MQTLPNKSQGEAKVITFDFTKELAEGTTLSSPTVAKSVISGTDPGAAGLTVGSASVAGSLVQALVSAGVEGAVYKLLARATASNGEVHEIAARLGIGEPA